MSFCALVVYSIKEKFNLSVSDDGVAIITPTKRNTTDVIMSFMATAAYNFKFIFSPLQESVFTYVSKIDLLV